MQKSTKTVHSPIKEMNDKKRESYPERILNKRKQWTIRPGQKQKIQRYDSGRKIEDFHSRSKRPANRNYTVLEEVNK